MKKAQKWQTSIPPMVLYKNSAGTNVSKQCSWPPKCKSGTLSQCVYIKMLTNDSDSDQKRKQAATKHSIVQNKGYHTKKMILGPVTPKISTMDQKCQNNDRNSME